MKEQECGNCVEEKKACFSLSFISLFISLQVWCVGSGNDNQTRYYINRTVDGTTLSTLLKGLIPGVLYQVEVAAVTGTGVGTRSHPVSVLISEFLQLFQQENSLVSHG